MVKTVMRISPGGKVRAIHNDDYDFKVHGCGPPKRASHVEPIQQGPSAGRWYVDMSPLGPTFAYCLWPSFDRRDTALAAEHDHIVENWIERDGPNETS